MMPGYMILRIYAGEPMRRRLGSAPIERRCSRCKKWMPEEANFSFHMSRCGYSPRCKTCMTMSVRESYRVQRARAKGVTA